MKAKPIKIILRGEQHRDRAVEILRMLPFEPVMEVTIKPFKDSRTLEQNNKMWGVLTDISNQVDWYGKKPTPDEWKQIITAAIKKQEVVPGIEGGFVILGQSTSKMTIAEMSDVIEYGHAFGASKGVVWKDPSDVINSGGEYEG